MSAIQIGKAINAILLSNEELKTLVRSNIFPLIAEENTPFPFIIYKRSSSDDMSSKDFIYQEHCEIEVAIVGYEYNQSVELADKVRSIMINTKGVYEGFNIQKIRLISTDETFYNGGYIQNLKFNIKINL